MLSDYAVLGGVELWNTVRLTQYLESVGSPLTSFTPCGCPTLTAASLGDSEYTTPDDPDSAAPWYDESVPESADFIGFFPLEISGVDEYPVTRSITNAVTGGGVLGPARVLPRTITVTGLLLGRTCCSVDYGRHWLEEALQGCAGNECEGDCMEVLACCPDEELDELCLKEQHGRTLRRVALVDGPRIIARAGDGCSGGECSGGDILTVEFTLVAATPWLWTDAVPVLESRLPRDDSDTCITWCIKGGTNQRTFCTELVNICPPAAIGVPETTATCTGLTWPIDDTEDECDATCRFAPCPDATETCADTRCAPPTPPTVAQLATCYCLPLAVERQCCDVDLTQCPAWSVDTPIINVRAGSEALRNLTITIYERTLDEADLTCEEIADAKRCAPFAVFFVGYVPSGGAVTIDGQIGRAIVECGGVCESSPDVYGADGGPLQFPQLTCSMYVVCLETDVSNPPAADSLFKMSLSGRGF